MNIPIENQPMTEADWAAVVRHRLPRLDGHPHEPDEVDDYAIAGRRQRWTRAEVMGALAALIVEFHAYRITPGHFHEKITELRRQIGATWRCPDPPREFADDPAAEIAWRRRAARDYRDRAMLAVAAGDPLEEVPLTVGEPDLVALRDRGAELRRRIETLAEPMAIAPPPTDPPTRRRNDPAERAAARAELDSRREVSETA